MQQPYTLTFRNDRTFEFTVRDKGIAQIFSDGARSLRKFEESNSPDGRPLVTHGNELFTILSFGDNEHKDANHVQHHNDGIIRGKLNDDVPANEDTKNAIIKVLKEAAKQQYEHLAQYADLQSSTDSRMQKIGEGAAESRQNYESFVDRLNQKQPSAQLVSR